MSNVVELLGEFWKGRSSSVSSPVHSNPRRWFEKPPLGPLFMPCCVSSFGLPLVACTLTAVLPMSYLFSYRHSNFLFNYLRAYHAPPPVLPVCRVQDLRGWKEVEYEVVRDNRDNCITVCNMEVRPCSHAHTYRTCYKYRDPPIVALVHCTCSRFYGSYCLSFARLDLHTCFALPKRRLTRPLWTSLTMFVR